MVMAKNKRISIHTQVGRLQHFFPDSTYKIVGYSQGFIWEGSLKPYDLSNTYDIRIEYNVKYHPKVFVINPKPLPLAKEEIELPHVHNHQEQLLCLYHIKKYEWNESMMIAETIIPWTSEWLLHYEIWVATGIWHGGGIH